MRKGVVLFSLFLTACSWSPVLPDREADLSNFVPREEVEQEENLEKTEELDFVAQNFPNNCDWQPYVRAVDGDTIIVGDNIKVRFVGIDTPEIKHPSKPIQPWGPEASAKTKKLLKGSTWVCLLNDEISGEYDKYARRLAYPLTEQGVDISVELLKEGLARGYYYFGFEREAEFRAYEKEAKEAGIGVWEK